MAQHYKREKEEGMRKTARIGAVSEGTMRPEDLIPAFCDELRELDTEGEYAALLMEASTWMDIDAEDWARIAMESTSSEIRDRLEDGNDILGELFDALESFSPPYCFFGASEGDGACYGWFPSWDSIRDAVHDGEILALGEGRNDKRWEDLTEEEQDLFSGYVLHVNNHGNATMYTVANGKMEEVWAIV
jgi:hypothetical protein